MKFILATLLCLCCWSVFGDRQATAQTPDRKPEIVDPTQFDVMSGYVLPEDQKARLDNLVSQLRQQLDQVTYIFVYAGQRPCPGETRAKMAFVKNHLVKTRGIEPDRVFLRDGGYREELTVEMWLWPRKSEFGLPSATPNVDPGEVEIRRNCRPISRRNRVRRKSRRP
ncbi:MAG: hypothetical protein QOD32_3300 [Pyrinomonadaceae bacterium]|jgi:hypothetical protein|nr:hypothetical protein [Pyrinomonadaceae bacterium]